MIIAAFCGLLRLIARPGEQERGTKGRRDGARQWRGRGGTRPRKRPFSIASRVRIFSRSCRSGARMRGGAGPGNGERGAGTEETLRLPGYAKLPNMYTSYITLYIYCYIIQYIYISYSYIYLPYIVQCTYAYIVRLVCAGPSPGSPLPTQRRPSAARDAIRRNSRNKTQ